MLYTVAKLLLPYSWFIAGIFLIPTLLKRMNTCWMKSPADIIIGLLPRNGVLAVELAFRPS